METHDPVCNPSGTTTLLGGILIKKQERTFEVVENELKR